MDNGTIQRYLVPNVLWWYLYCWCCCWMHVTILYIAQEIKLETKKTTILYCPKCKQLLKRINYINYWTKCISLQIGYKCPSNVLEMIVLCFAVPESAALNDGDQLIALVTQSANFIIKFFHCLISSDKGEYNGMFGWKTTTHGKSLGSLTHVERWHMKTGNLQSIRHTGFRISLYSLCFQLVSNEILEISSAK